ncbi:MAG: hypothetical protein KME64_11495 [Scytonematopsis contorta HA4267-MV1]|jgi:hypothetical protein|nr:hypothetical protein [Scytonematopsis contorta HA4267-MV1]
MQNIEVVSNVESFALKEEPADAALIMVYLKNAISYQEKALEIYNVLNEGKSVKPKMVKRKTIAVSDNTGVISGWNSLNPKWNKFIAENYNVSLEQNETKVREFYQNHIEKFNQYGYKTKKWDLDPQEDLGKHYRSHAEKQISVIKPCNSIGVSRGICEEDCYPYLRALAQIRQQHIVVADPNGVYLFHYNGQVKFVYHDK